MGEEGALLRAWAPLGVGEVVDLLDDASFHWVVAGGHALELALGRSWRDHDAAVVIPWLDADARRSLSVWLPGEHPWQALVAACD